MKNDLNLHQIWKDIYQLAEINETQRLSFDLLIEDTKLEKIDNKNKLLIVTTNTKIDEVVLNSDFYQTLKDSINKMLNLDYDLSIIFKDDYKKLSSKKSEIRAPFINSLNPNFIFDTFVASKDNKLLFKAALAVSLTETNNWNPFFIHGKSGLGKTHLLHAIGNSAKKKFPNKLIKYIEAKDFGNIVVKAFESKNINENLEKIRDEYERYDLLLVDDIQFIQSRKKTKEIFFNIFNFFINNKKQVVVTSDQNPEELRDFEERFITRFKSGLLLSIVPPDIDTAKEILKLKIESMPDLDFSSFTEEALEWIAINFGGNIRYLEGSLNKLSLFNIDEEKPNFKRNDLSKVIEIFQEATTENKHLTMQGIISVVSKHYAIPKSELLGKSRKKEILIPRNISIYLIREILNESLIDIGKEFKKDHTTILNSLNKIEKMTKENSKLKDSITEIRRKLLITY